MAFVSQIEPKTICDALWVVVRHDELNQFTINDVWFLVPKFDCMNVIGTEWVFRNKLDESGMITRNKVGLVAKGYNKKEDIDYDETFAPIARLQAKIIACICLYEWFQTFSHGCEKCISQ